MNKYQYQVESGSSVFNCMTIDEAINLMYEKSIEGKASVIDRKGKTICSAGLLLKGEES